MMESNQNFKLGKAAAAGLLLVAIILVVGLISPVKKKAEALSLYTPFGGKVEEYKSKSDAQCVDETCGEINNKVRNLVRKAIAAPAAAICTAISAPCSLALGIGMPICYAACEGAINGAVEAINVCDVEEIKVGPPKKASVGILNFGTVNITIFGKTLLKLRLSSLLPDLSVIAPSVYDYKDYTTKGNWVLGDSLNILNFCKVGEVGGEGTSKICKNVIMEVLLGEISGGQEKAGNKAYDDALATGATESQAQKASSDAKLDYATSCPLLNLLHQVGTSRAPLIKVKVNTSGVKASL